MAPRAPGPEPVTRVLVERVDVAPGPRRAPELAGRVAGLLEWRLGSLDGVVASVAGAPPSPGLADALLDRSETWTVGLDVEGADDAITLRARCCDPSTLGCVTIEGGPAPALEVGAAVDAVVTGLAGCVGRTPSVLSSPARQSPDDYAELLAGRAAATFYGWLPAPPPEDHGDPRKDVFRRAVFVDPDMPLGRWFAGREALRRGQLVLAAEHLGRARELVATQPTGVADELAARLELGQVGGASELAALLDSGSTQDLRFLGLRTRALLAAGRAADAEARLGELPAWVLATAAVAEDRVRLADALRLPAAEVDARLAAWAAADARALEPVRRRARVAVLEGRLADALPFAEELGRRGATEEGERLAMAILTAQRRWADAAERARRVGEDELAARLLARGPEGGEGGSAMARMARAARLAGADPDAAVALGEQARAAWGDEPDAWRALAEVYQRAQRAVGADAALLAAERLEPSTVWVRWPPPVTPARP